MPPALRPALSRRRGLTVLATALLLMGGLVGPVAAGPRTSTAPAGLIAFTATVDGASQVFTVRPDGTGRKQVTANVTGTKKCDPVLNPTNGQVPAGGTAAREEVAYAASDGRVYVHDLAGGAALDVAPSVEVGKRGGSRRPAWSPDGNTLVFHFSLDGSAAAPTYDLWMVNREGAQWSPARRITAVPSGAQALYPRYQPVAGSAWLAYTYRTSGTAVADLMLAEVPTSHPGLSGDVQVVPGSPLLSAVDPYLATWSRSGTRIAYVSACATPVQVTDVRLSAGAWTASAPRSVTGTSGCAASFSPYDENLLVFADTTGLHVKDVSSTRKASAVTTGGMPSWG